MTILPKCWPVSRWRKASFASSNGKTLSTTGLVPDATNAGNHLRQHAARTDIDALHPQRLHEDLADVQRLLQSRQHADDADLPADCGGTQRKGQRTCSTNLQHVRHALTVGKLAHLLVPVGMLFVVDGLVRAQGSGALQLLVGAAGQDGARTPQPGNLQPEDADAARSQEQDRVLRTDVRGADQRMPCRDRRTGESRGLFEGHALRNRNQCTVWKDLVRGQRAIHSAAERGGRRSRCGRTIQPIDEEGRHHTVTRLEGRHIGANGHNLSRAVRAGDARLLHLRVVDAPHQHQVTIVQGNCTDTDEYIMRPGIGKMNGVEGESVDAEVAGETKCLCLHAAFDAQSGCPMSRF